MNKILKRQKRQTEAPIWAKSIAEASRITGTSRVTLTGFRRDGCPAFKSNGQVNLVELDAWQEVHGRRTVAETAELKAERLRILRATAARLERENKRADLLIIDRAAVLAVARKCMSMLFEEMNREFVLTLPAALQGLDATAIEAKLLASTEIFKANYKRRLEALETSEIELENNNHE